MKWIFRISLAFLAAGLVPACGGGGGGRPFPGVVFLSDGSLIASDLERERVRLLYPGNGPDGGVAYFQWAPDRRWVAFVGRDGLFMVPAKGGFPTRVDDGIDIDSAVPEYVSTSSSWSPDGSRFAYRKGGNLFTCAVPSWEAGKVRYDLPVNCRLEMPYFWSPDSAMLLIRGYDPILRDRALYTAPAAGGALIRITQRLVVPLHREPVPWSSDGSRIAFASADGIFTVTPQGTDEAQVAPLNSTVQSLEWSPDGSRLAYVGDPDARGQMALYVSPPDGSYRIRVSPVLGTTFNILGFSWSPEGSRLSFAADPVVDGRHDLFTTPADQADSWTEIATNAYGLSWAPDGSRLAFNSGGELYSCLPDGTGIVKLTPLSAAGLSLFSFEWAPDGRKVAFTCTDLAVNAILYSCPADQSDAVQLTEAYPAGGLVIHHRWSWDSHRIVFMEWNGSAGYVNSLDSIRPDGTGRVPLSGEVDRYYWNFMPFEVR